jgi:hypothetical protein
MHSNILANLLLGDDLLVQHGRSTALEPVVPLLGLPRVGRLVVPHERRLVLGDDGHIDVASRAQIVPDTGLDGVGAQSDGVFSREVLLPLCLEDRHGGQRAGSHCHVRQLISGAVGVHSEEMRASGVDAGDHEVGTDVALVPEQVLLQHGHAGDDAGLAAGGEGVQFEVRRDDGRGELGVCRGSGTGAPDVGGDVVQFLAVLYDVLDVFWCLISLWRGMRTLSATMGPLVARVSAAITTPPLNRQPTMVVPVLVALGSGTPWAWRAALRLWLEKSKPPIVVRYPECL